MLYDIPKNLQTINWRVIFVQTVTYATIYHVGINFHEFQIFVDFVGSIYL